ncbi:aldehyde dehydrogenase [Gordonia sp. LSe1-13]|uniref:Aldehyde dehydrogenase n=1 Tax=Gordonia sesuvii TaxID=3116777 RepID=A0ABU7MIX8_9ACTN|nr:aldehyde dehydrogenase [Gordonia sp. LSe1-13]
MTASQVGRTELSVRNPDSIFVNGAWVTASSTTVADVIDSNDESVYYQVASAGFADMDQAVGAARTAFDDGPWPRMTHAQRAEFMRAMATEMEKRSAALADIWPRESGALYVEATQQGATAANILRYYADQAATYQWEEVIPPTRGGNFGLLVREPVGVVGAIIPWNGPLMLAMYKVAPALISGCTLVLKASLEAPGAAYVIAEAAEAAGLPPGVLNVLAADRDVSEALVRDPRTDKIAFTGSTAAGRRIAALMGEKIGRVTLELGGKSAAIILDDADLESAARSLAASECHLAGQVCASLTRLIVTRSRHDEFVDAVTAAFGAKRVGNAFAETSDIGPLATRAQLDRVQGYVDQGLDRGAVLATGGRRPKELDKGYFFEPTVFGNVDNQSVIAQEEIFGPVLTVIPAKDEDEAIRFANDTIYGLNSAVFTADVDRARHVAGQIRAGTVGHNSYRADFGIAFGGFKQSGVGREGGVEGLHAYLEAKTVVLDDIPERYR